MQKGCCVKKLFGIEKKLIKPMSMCFFNEWHLWRKYATEKQRDEALKALSSNGFMWEYRKVNL